MHEQFHGSPRPSETPDDYRKRMAVIQAEALERRQHELDQQSSPEHTPGDRIRIWERLHQLSLPRTADHRLLGVIAAKTGLSLEQVQDEQRTRATAKAAAAVG
ncbi:MAG TPA: hypothetical protein VHZ99_13535 [Steroidobacteraceae bacterium]|nr:hypothetical protein [Steroidobacteraceae bacterium]